MSTCYYINTTSGDWPVYEGDIKLMFPNTSFPSTFGPVDGFASVADVIRPDFDTMTHGCSELAPALLDGSYVRQWEVFALSAEQIAANQQAFAINRLNEITIAVQARLDNWAKERFYDGILSLCTYATSSVPKFAAEGQRGVDNRDATWAQCYAIMADYTNGQRPLPTVDEVISGLPPLDWLVV